MWVNHTSLAILAARAARNMMSRVAFRNGNHQIILPELHEELMKQSMNHNETAQWFGYSGVRVGTCAYHLSYAVGSLRNHLHDDVHMTDVFRVDMSMMTNGLMPDTLTKETTNLARDTVLLRKYIAQPGTLCAGELLEYTRLWYDNSVKCQLMIEKNIHMYTASELRNGEICGRRHVYTAAGIAYGMWQHDELHGTRVVRYPTIPHRYVSVIEYRRGILHGRCRKWNDNGTMKLDVCFKNGEPRGPEIMLTNGHIDRIRYWGKNSPCTLWNYDECVQSMCQEPTEKQMSRIPREYWSLLGREN